MRTFSELFGKLPKNVEIVPQISADFGNFPKNAEKLRTIHQRYIRDGLWMTSAAVTPRHPPIRPVAIGRQVPPARCLW